MHSEIEIILEEPNNYKQGNCFENLIREFLSTQRYEVSSNINFTGMEVDLVAKHKDNFHSLYVECKAKNKVSSTELKNFAFNVFHKKVDFGYFIRTKELEHQAGGLMREMKSEERYKNISFFEPQKVIEVLGESGKILDYRSINVKETISKLILVVSYLGDFYVAIISSSLMLPTHFYVINCQNGESESDENLIYVLKENISSIRDLELKKTAFYSAEKKIIEQEYSKIAEVQESENWYDPRPAALKYFLGRDDLSNNIFAFYKRVLESKTDRRIFYLMGKSGWGKSSIVVSIRGKSKNKYYKNRFFVTAIDSRSATSPNFVAISFKKILENAISSGFIKRTIFNDLNLKFNSNQDIISSPSVKNILQYLKENGKVLVLIFDQFEDVFRKEDIFNSFYKFLLDVNDSKSNIIIGFSWKTEILIPSENETYYLWRQTKDLSLEYIVPEFGNKEINGVISQLESSIGKISIDLKRRLVEASQGFPWLIKKLCIHIYNQHLKGNIIDQLIDQNLNIQTLFDNDLILLSGDETKAIKYIAKSAYDGTFFEVTEVGEIIEQKVIDSLLHKRLIIRTGSYYNIYWDIFRDYLVKNEIPVIGESYILRQSPSACYDVLKLFNLKKEYTISELLKIHPRQISEQSLYNVLIELRKLGLIKRKSESKIYYVEDHNSDFTIDFLSEYITKKFQTFTPYLKIKNNKNEEITVNKLLDIYKEIFKTYSYKNRTWQTYSNHLAAWLALSKLNIKFKDIYIPAGEIHPISRRDSNYATANKINKYIKRTELNPEKYFLRTAPEALLLFFKKYVENPNDFTSITKTEFKFGLRDLSLLGLVELDENFYIPTEISKGLKSSQEIIEFFKRKSSEIPKIKAVLKFITENKSKITAKIVLKQIPELIENRHSESTKIVYANIILSWARFIIRESTEINIEDITLRKKVLWNTKRLYIRPDKIFSWLLIVKEEQPTLSNLENYMSYDLRKLGIVQKSGSRLEFTKKGFEIIESEDVGSTLAELIVNIEFISEIHQLVKEDDSLGVKDLLRLKPALVEGFNSNTTKFSQMSVYLAWSKFIRNYGV